MIMAGPPNDTVALSPLSVEHLRIDAGCLPAAQLTETTSRSVSFRAGTSRGVVTCAANRCS
jgi:hypothetical protein